MWDGKEGLREEGERPSSLENAQKLIEFNLLKNTSRKGEQVHSAVMKRRKNEEEEEEEDDEEDEDGDVLNMHGMQPIVMADMPNIQSSPSSTFAESIKESQVKSESSSLAGQEQDIDGDLDFDPDGDYEANLQGKWYPCQYCERHFSTRQGLERHIHIHSISNQQAQQFKCRYCNKSFGSQVGRRRHERRHESISKKRPASLAGVTNLLKPVVQTDSSPDCNNPTSHYIAIGSQFTGSHLHDSKIQRNELGHHPDRSFVLEAKGESKELHPCKYCNKAFGTHTNMRRHQRRIHERHLLPKGVRRKGMLPVEAAAPQPGESPNTSPPPVYVPSADTEDETDRDDYVIDISKNISENLSFYIDGKIVSNSAVSSCDVIEVDSRSAALFGLDTVIISPNQISQAVKVESRTSVAKQLSHTAQSVVKRRTSTPPLIPTLKTELETTPTSSLSSTSSSSSMLMGGLFHQAADSSVFQREKTVYLSPKLKQLLQTQDIQNSAITLITESHRLASKLSVTSLQGISGTFKRRTASPPSSPQLSPVCRVESCKTEGQSSCRHKDPNLDSDNILPIDNQQHQEDGDSLDDSTNKIHDLPSSSSSGSSCNQLPLDLSNSVSRRSDSFDKGLGDSVLDLSLHRKNSFEPDTKGNAAPQPPVKKRKPNTSMLEKVLMNEYLGPTVSGEESPSSLVNLSHQPHCPTVSLDSFHPSPPSLTPITLNPSSPSPCSGMSPTPPPPVLPTVPSPPVIPGSPLSQPLDSSLPRPLPVLSPNVSPMSVENKDELHLEDNKDEENQIPQTPDSPNTPLIHFSHHSVTLSHPQPVLVDLPSTDSDTCHLLNCNSSLNGTVNQDQDAVPVLEEKVNFNTGACSSQAKYSTSPAPTSYNSPSSLVVKQLKVKEEPPHCDELSVTNHVPQECADSSSQLADQDEPCNKTSASDDEDLSFCKTFVCNVCNEPFSSIKELSGHITEHATDWPFKCEFCVQLFSDGQTLLDHRTLLHEVGQIFVCSICSKEFAFLCNLKQHQKDLHPNEMCSHSSVASGKLRPQNYTDPSRAKEESVPSTPAPEMMDESMSPSSTHLVKEEPDVNGNHAEDRGEDPNEELYTMIKIMASEGGKPKGPDVRLGINQHYPSYKPPPFPYHSRSHAGSVASATNFTTHNIPQTFTTAIRCTKCGNSFDNMPELHKHILACASASDKKRYTPKKNPIPLKQIVKSPNRIVSPTAAAAGQNAFRRMGQPKRLNFNQEPGKSKMSALSKKKNQLVQKAISQRNKAVTPGKKTTVKVEHEPASNVCPHCSREFTYTASLTKHMAVSCPMKPVGKKGKKVQTEIKNEAPPMPDKNMSLRKKPADVEVQTESETKPLGKTRARTSGAAESDTSPPSKGKPTAPVARLKRPASFPAQDVAVTGKRVKKSKAQSRTQSVVDTLSDTPPQPAMRMQRVGKEGARKKETEAKSSLQQRKEERVSLRTRERVGGPVTRSLQSTTAPSTEVKSEDPTDQEPKDTQEVPVK